MADFNITDPEIIKMLDGLTEEGRQDVADQVQESLDSGEVKKIIEETKGNHPTTSEDSLLQSKIRCPIGRAGSNPAIRTI